MSQTRYTTRGGETWASIAYFAYNDTTKIPDLIRANPLLPIYDQFPVGVEVNVPIFPNASTAAVLPPWKRAASTPESVYEPTPILPAIIRSAPLLPVGFISESDRKPPIFAWTGIVSLVSVSTGSYRIAGTAYAWNGSLFYPAADREVVFSFDLGNGSVFEVAFDYSSNIANIATATPTSSTTTTLSRNDATTLANVGWNEIKAYVSGFVTDGMVQMDIAKVTLHTSSALKLFGSNAVEIEVECYFRNKAGDGSSDVISYGIAESYDAQNIAITGSFEASATSVSLAQDTFAQRAMVIEWGNGTNQYSYPPAGVVTLSNTYSSGQGRDFKLYNPASNIKNVAYSNSKLAGTLDLSRTTTFEANVNFDTNASLTSVMMGSSSRNITSLLGFSCSLGGVLDMSEYSSITGSFRVHNNSLDGILFDVNTGSVTFMDLQNNDLTELDLSGWIGTMNANNARINLLNNNFAQSEIDSFLTTLDGITVGGYTGRTVTLTGGSMAAPSAVGLAAVANLFLKGITVSHN